MNSLRAIVHRAARMPSLLHVRAFSSSAITLPELPYEYNALEPAISGQIMETHHKKHHQTYVNNLNNAMTQLQEAQHKGDVSSALALLQAVKFNGGGHVNHSIFWRNLAPVSRGGGQVPTSGALAELVTRDYRSFDRLKEIMSAQTMAIQGSGWGWLAYNPSLKRLEVTTRANQDPLLEGLVPLLGLDVWEHAYYYKYGPARAEYLKNIWSIINWADVQQRLEAAHK